MEKSSIIETFWQGYLATLPPEEQLRDYEVWYFGNNKVDEKFAFDYGEGERTLAWWRRALWGFYAGICAEIGREPSETMPLDCQRFRVLFSLNE